MAKVHSFAQLVKKPTRKNATLTNVLRIVNHLSKRGILPQFGKSDHYAFMCKPKHAIKYDKGHTLTEKKRIMGRNEKSLFAHAISQVDWTPMYQMDSCEVQFAFFDL